MKIEKLKLLFGILCIAMMALYSGVAAQQQQGQSNSETQKNQQTTSKPSEQSGQDQPPVRGVLLFSDSIIGASVQNPLGEDIGDIQRLLINPQTGLVSYVEISVGGFLGMGDKNVVVPWRALTASREGDALVLNVSRKILQEAPTSENVRVMPPPPPPPPAEQQGQQKQN